MAKPYESMPHTPRKYFQIMKVWDPDYIFELRRLRRMWVLNKYGEQIRKRQREEREARLTPAQKAAREERKRLQELDLCTKCKEKTRFKKYSSKSTWCYRCTLDAQNEYARRKRIQKKLDDLAAFNFTCLNCKIAKIDKPLSKDGRRVRFICHPCYVEIRKRVWRKKLIKYEIRRLILEAKERLGIGATVLDPLKMIEPSRSANTLM